MNLFISWSGERSGLVAKALHQWIKCVIQSIEPFFSPNDIEGGTIWMDKLYNKLGSSSAGIICLTPENQHAPWIQFEAGALAKGLSDNRVFILLIGLESSDVSGPLSSFNHTSCTKEGIEKLMKNLNDLTGEKKLSSEIFSRVFSLNFPEINGIFESAIKLKSKDSITPERDAKDIQNEMLKLLRGLTNRVSDIEERTRPKQLEHRQAIYGDNIEKIVPLDLTKNNYYGSKKLNSLLKKMEEIEREKDLGESSSNGGGI
ncbi:toll/interleukin-1 receptor domain-containing protein [Algoriphagus zhangzhouensis]|uniref:TIR domain-containing protein n=1 Tax=Algoriphagus zhangzhouensis TaxID=1073327 RepID=A0A1M7ZJ17_9BACT|nr:toll/interleukin-1 receptor domain-containing protein [Algoriphagus zhangzhouensis]TDY43629.1 TIR domain-containing protein [Algoriphagus zhangzhouensis]SHO64905.1 TIR domain-containing protein [Algoriphagus zhangzhouensis]